MLRFLHIDDDALRDWLMAPEEHPPPPDYWPKFETPEQYGNRLLSGEYLKVRYEAFGDNVWGHVVWTEANSRDPSRQLILLDFAQCPKLPYNGLHRGGDQATAAPTLPGRTGWFVRPSYISPMEN